ncbi:hypothetical protein GCM10020229_56800 [Kitasatospora albolonga]
MTALPGTVRELLTDSFLRQLDRPGPGCRPRWRPPTAGLRLAPARQPVRL